LINLEEGGEGPCIGEGALGVEERAVLPAESRLYCRLVLGQTGEVRVDGVDGEASEGVVGSSLLHLTDCSQSARLLLHSGEVESGVNEVDAEEEEGGQAEINRLILMLVLFVICFHAKITRKAPLF